MCINPYVQDVCVYKCMDIHYFVEGSHVRVYGICTMYACIKHIYMINGVFIYDCLCMHLGMCV